MPTIRVAIVSPSPGFYNFGFVDANNDSVRKGFHGVPEARLLHELEKLPAPAAASIIAKLQGPLPLIEFVAVDDVTYRRLFAE